MRVKISIEIQRERSVIIKLCFACFTGSTLNIIG